jgi:formylmethanofuran dehydrogenase subunit C
MIMELAARRRMAREGNASMAARKRFGNYKREESKTARTQDVSEDRTLQRLIGAWCTVSIETCSTLESSMEVCSESIKGIEITSGDIESFCIALADFQDEHDFGRKAGYFLDAMIKQCEENVVVIRVGHLDEEVFGIGRLNSKDILVEGNIAWGLGDDMEGGVITIRGSAGDNVGNCMKGGSIVIEEDILWGCDGIANSMKGGELIVKGDVNGTVGHAMEGGKVIILGDVILKAEELGDDIGAQMKGGEIHIMGEIRNEGIGTYDAEDLSWLGENCQGKIFHKGKFIAGKCCSWNWR